VPTYRGSGDDAAPIPIVQFDPRLEVSPFAVFRRLREAGETARPLLVDVRAQPGELTLAGAVPWEGEEWEPPEDRDVVLFDDADTRALDLARELQSRGHARVRALFGGLELWQFALDPEVLGEATYLVRR
jgi:hypothetical protein